MQRRQIIPTLFAAAAVAALTPLAALAQAGKEVKIALIASKTGPLEAYAKQTIVGFMMGLDYATGGSMTVAGRKLVVIEKDDQGKPDVGKAALAAASCDELRPVRKMYLFHLSPVMLSATAEIGRASCRERVWRYV